MFSEVVDAAVGLSDEAVVERLRELEAERRRLDSETALLINVADRRGLHHADAHRSINEFLRAELNWSQATASTYRSLSRAVDHVPGLGDAWHAGHIGLPQATKLAKVHGNRRVRDHLPAAAPVLLRHAEELPYSDFAVVADEFVKFADADGAHIDRDENIEHRTAHVLAVGGSLDMGASGGDPLVVAEMIAIFDRFCDREYALDLEARATRWPNSADEHPLPRSARQRRFDALVAMFRAASTAGSADRGPQADYLVNVVVDIDTWNRMLISSGLGNDLVDTAVCIDDPKHLMAELLTDPSRLAHRRCETSNGVSLDPHDVLRAALGGHIRTSIVDGRNVTINHGRKQRLFTGAARDAAKLLVRHCQHPGCELPVDMCEVDHMDEWDRHDGATDQDNADIRCSLHNRAKHRQRWRTKRAANGRTYTVRSDGTIMLPVGARPPDFSSPDTPSRPSATGNDQPIDLLEHIRTVTQQVDDLISHLSA